MLTIAIILSVVILAGVFVYIRNKELNLLEEGKIIKRNDRFYDEEEIFTVKNATYEKVKEEINLMDFSGIDVEVYPDSDDQEAIVFKSGGGWNALLMVVDKKDDVTVYNLKITIYNSTSGGLAYYPMEMNVLFTSIEKLFLKLDPNTRVETREIKRKTKTKLF